SRLRLSHRRETAASHRRRRAPWAVPRLRVWGLRSWAARYRQAILPRVRPAWSGLPRSRQEGPCSADASGRGARETSRPGPRPRPLHPTREPANAHEVLERSSWSNRPRPARSGLALSGTAYYSAEPGRPRPAPARKDTCELRAWRRQSSRRHSRYSSGPLCSRWLRQQYPEPWVNRTWSDSKTWSDSNRSSGNK